MMRPIHPGLAPNLRKQDALLALREIITPWNYFKGNTTVNLEKWFQSFYDRNAFAFSSGRGGLFAILSSLQIGIGDDVLVEAFTCVAVVDAILATGARPIYVDIKNDFTIDIEDAKKKITPRTRAIIIQHTFAIPNYKKELDDLIEKHRIYLIEDMAHGIGIMKGKEKIGTRGIATLFSFGRDKSFSSVSGGMVITKDKKLNENLRKFQEEQQESSTVWVFQNLFHMVSFYFLILPFYDFLKIGKLFLVLFKNTGLLSKPIDTEELRHFSVYTAKLSPVLAKIALAQLESLHSFNKKREKAVVHYNKRIEQKFLQVPEGSLLRYPVFVENPKEFKTYMRKNGVYVGDWYSNVIDPKGTDIYSLLYEKGSCPTAEIIASHVANLPTYPTMAEGEIEKVSTLYIDYAKNK